MEFDFSLTNDDLFSLECLDNKLKVKKDLVQKKTWVEVESYRVKGFNKPTRHITLRNV